MNRNDIERCKIEYLKGYVDGLLDNLDDAKEEQEVLHTKEDTSLIEFEIQTYIESFDAIRTAYIADLERLRSAYRPAFKSLLKLVKEKKAKLKEMQVKSDE